MRFVWFFVIFAGMAVSFSLKSMSKSPYAKLSELELNRVELKGGFWGEKREQLWKTVLRYQWTQMESHNDVNNFRILAGEKNGVHLGPVYLDSDLYKWLEAACYVSGKHPEDEWLSARISELSGLFAKVQMPDGYINTYYQSFAPERRWTNLVMNHELYCSGHLIEAGVAHKEATGRDELLSIAIKLADHIDSVFGPGKNPGVPGHEEIELALIRLYRETGEKRYLELASHFIHQRGRYTRYPQALLNSLKDQSELSKIVNEKRAPYLNKAPKAGSAAGYIIGGAVFDPRIPWSFFSGKYFQDDKPFVEMSVAEGHAVRAMYFFTGATDVYLETGEAQLLESAERIWDNTISKRTYITGGMGALPVIEGFGRDYELPNRSYTETCAGIGSFFWNWRMLRATADAKYADLMERTLYNAILPAISLDGTKYFYQNPLASFGHDQRQPWYGCACCPPNIARLFGSLERYLYSESDAGIWFHQYISGSAEFKIKGQKVKTNLESGFPFQGDVKIKLNMDKPGLFSIMLRIPEWAKSVSVSINNETISKEPEPGTYLKISREWKDGDEIRLNFAMEIMLIESPPEVKNNLGKVAIKRGPLIYCLEDKDNPGINVHRAVLLKSQKLSSELTSNFPGGVVLIKGKTVNGKNFTAIPYYLWSNRGPSDMEIWIKAN